MLIAVVAGLAVWLALSGPGAWHQAPPAASSCSTESSRLVALDAPRSLDLATHTDQAVQRNVATAQRHRPLRQAAPGSSANSASTFAAPPLALAIELSVTLSKPLHAYAARSSAGRAPPRRLFV